MEFSLHVLWDIYYLVKCKFKFFVMKENLSRSASRREKPRGRHHGLSQQKKQEIKEAFELFDTDGSGIDSAFYLYWFIISILFFFPL